MLQEQAIHKVIDAPRIFNPPVAERCVCASEPVPGATIVAADDAQSLQPHLHADAILLVNRVLEDGFDTESGIELIESLAESEPKPIMMLVSNLPEAQEQAALARAEAESLFVRPGEETDETVGETIDGAGSSEDAGDEA